MIYKYPQDAEIIKKKLESRTALYTDETIEQVSAIFAQVKERGDAAIRENTLKFDHAELLNVSLSDDFIKECTESISEELRDAILHSKKNISDVNEALMPEKCWTKEIREGTIIGEQVTPLNSVGLWVPARKAPLVSAAIMLVVAAKVAGVKRIVVGMPPALDGQPNKATVAAAKLAGADEIVVGNGISIIGAFCHGTETIKDVDAIYGPGPGAIAASMALAFVYGKRTVVGIGPTDSAIFADDSANLDFLIKDIFNEAEHGFDSSSVLVTTSADVANELDKRINDELKKDLKRKDILMHMFGEGGMGFIVLADNNEEAYHFINEYAPEHLMLYVKEELQSSALSNIVNAGEVLIGEYSPFTSANYAIGITAVLPTSGYAKRNSGITCKDMIKYTTIGKLSKQALEKLYPTIKELGEHEGLPNHVEAVRVRVEK